MSYKLQEPEVRAAVSLISGGLSASPEHPLSLEVITLKEPQSRDEKLNRAISRLIPAALERRQGILVIQRDFGMYTVRLDREVPCGTTREVRIDR